MRVLTLPLLSAILYDTATATTGRPVRFRPCMRYSVCICRCREGAYIGILGAEMSDGSPSFASPGTALAGLANQWMVLAAVSALTNVEEELFHKPGCFPKYRVPCVLYLLKRLGLLLNFSPKRCRLVPLHFVICCH